MERAARRWHGTRTSLVAGALLVAGTSANAGPEAVWRVDWNERVDRHERLRDHPCGDFAFDPWAARFLDGCSPAPAEREVDCTARLRWVTERATQCRVWKNWLLRNHNGQTRRDDIPEPPTRVR